MIRPLNEKCKPLRFFILTAACITNIGCGGTTTTGSINQQMQTFLVGRFRLDVPVSMNEKGRSEKLRYVEIEEFRWPQGQSREQVRSAEWERFWGGPKNTVKTDRDSNNVIKSFTSTDSKNWAKGRFVYDNNFSKRVGVWVVLVDAGSSGVWLRGEPSIVEKEVVKKLMGQNIQKIAQAYQPVDHAEFNSQQHEDRFYLKLGTINLPYLEQEESVLRFEGDQFGSLLIEMYMNFDQKIENTSLINGTRAMLAASLLIPGNSISKIRLHKREVAGMSGEESVLRVRERERTDLVFNWQFNGKKNSGEYPTTRIEMQSPDGNLDEKLQIWDAILDSMKPMFERKKS